ncbi:hypothetical protein Tco_1336737 [Tanacetum coccineum]
MIDLDCEKAGSEEKRLSDVGPYDLCIRVLLSNVARHLNDFQRDDTDDEPEDQELEAHYLYMAKIQEVTPDAADNSGPIFNTESLQKVQNDNDNYNVFVNDREHPEQPESVNDTYLEE